MEFKDVPKGNYGQTKWYTNDEVYEMDFLDENARLFDMAMIFRKYSGSQFSVAVLAKRYGFSVRQTQVDLAELEKCKIIQREKVISPRGKTEPNKIFYIAIDKLDKSLTLPNFKHLNREI